MELQFMMNTHVYDYDRKDVTHGTQ